MIIVNSRLLHQLHPLSVALFFSLLASVDVLTKNCIRLFFSWLLLLLLLLLIFFCWNDQIDDNFLFLLLLLFYDIYTDVTIAEYHHIQFFKLKLKL